MRSLAPRHGQKFKGLSVRAEKHLAMGSLIPVHAMADVLLTDTDSAPGRRAFLPRLDDDPDDRRFSPRELDIGRITQRWREGLLDV